MPQRTKLERDLEQPYEDKARHTTDNHYVTCFLHDIVEEYNCPPGYETELSAWAYGHPAVGGSHKLSYREKFTMYKRFKKTDMPAPVIEPLEEALIEYVRDLLPSFEGDKRRSKKHERLLGLVGETREMCYESLMVWVQQQDKNLFTQERGRTWWFDFHTNPEQADLIDRLEFMRICHHTNLKIVYEEPWYKPEPSFVRFHIFNPSHYDTYRASIQERHILDKSFKPRDDYDGEYPFDRLQWERAQDKR